MCSQESKLILCELCTLTPECTFVRTERGRGQLSIRSSLYNTRRSFGVVNIMRFMATAFRDDTEQDCEVNAGALSRNLKKMLQYPNVSN